MVLVLVFISYATKDAEKFQIRAIAEGLTLCPEIDDVLYWQEDLHDDIYKYMDENLGKCDVFVLFCSPSALESVPVAKEWRSADALNKPVIPVFTSPEYIPPLLASRLGIQIDVFNLEDNIKKLRTLIIKKVPKEAQAIPLQFKFPKTEAETVQTNKSTSFILPLLNFCMENGVSIKNILVTTAAGERVPDPYFDEPVSNVIAKFGSEFKIILEKTQIIANFKICIIGEEKSGKSKLLQYCVECSYDDEYIPTIGVDHWVKSFNHQSPEKDFEITLIFWDLGGSFDQFDTVKMDLFNETDGIFIVGDLTNKESFAQIESYWLPNIQKNLNMEVPIILLANKCDLEADIKKTVVGRLAKKLGIEKVFFTSAKTGENVDEAFKSIIPILIGKELKIL